MDTIVGTLMAVLAQGNTGVLETLPDMVGITGTGSATDSTWHLLDGRKMPPVCRR